MRKAHEGVRVVAFLLLLAGTSVAQTATYHLHKEASSTDGQLQLKTAGPDASSLTLLSGPITVPGDYTVAAFDTQAGVPNAAGFIPANSTVSFSLWMQASFTSSVLF